MSKRVILFTLTNMLVLITITIAFHVIIYAFGIDPAFLGYYPYLMALCAAWGFGGAFFSLFASKWMAKKAMGVQIIDPNTRDHNLRGLVDTVHRMSRKAGLPEMPEVGIYQNPEVNAFATGPSKKNSLVAVSTGLLNRMNSDEVEGVLAHEVAHIANGDMVTMTLIQGVVNAFVMFFARILANVASSFVDERFRFAVYFGLLMLFTVVFSVLGSLVVNYFSRLREYRADSGGATLAGREKMVAALRRLQANVQMVDTEQEGFATLKINHQQSGFAKLLSTHPPLEERIRRLEGSRVA